MNWKRITVPTPTTQVILNHLGMFKARQYKRHIRGEKNGLEAKYEAEVLIPQRDRGEVVAWHFEAVTLDVIVPNEAKPARLTPDYLVLMADGTIEMRDVKGFCEEDAKLKVKAASERYPWMRWYLVTKVAKKNGGGWKTEEI